MRPRSPRLELIRSYACGGVLGILQRNLQEGIRRLDLTVLGDQVQLQVLTKALTAAMRSSINAQKSDFADLMHQRVVAEDPERKEAKAASKKTVADPNSKPNKI